jgi:hypothetical protein
MIDFDDAEETLYVISKQQLARYSGRADLDDVYGLGYFCSTFEGVMLVANTRSCHLASWREYKEEYPGTLEEEFEQRWDDRSFAFLAESGMSDEDIYKWWIGNWEWPAGFDLYGSEERSAFDDAWEVYSEPLSRSEDDDEELSTRLQELCIRVLRRLKDDGDFALVKNLEGFMILGPDDMEEQLVSMKQYLDEILMRE